MEKENIECVCIFQPPLPLALSHVPSSPALARNLWFMGLKLRLPNLPPCTDPGPPPSAGLPCGWSWSQCTIGVAAPGDAVVVLVLQIRRRRRVVD